MNKKIQKTALRVPKDLHAKIHASAEDSGRSMNAEIVHRLEESFEFRAGPHNFNKAELTLFRKMVMREAKLILNEDEEREQKKLKNKA